MTHFPQKQGLYDPQYEKDSCGVGFVAHIKGKKSNEIVCRGLEVLDNMCHRGAAGADPKTGDGAGISIQMPHELFAKAYPALPPVGKYGSGLVFLPQDAKEAEFCKKEFEKAVLAEGQTVFAWRDVPVESSVLGEGARVVEPRILQIFITRRAEISRAHFERVLYIIRRSVERAVKSSSIKQASYFYVPSLSSYTFVYKGLLLPGQLKSYFLDLQTRLVTSAIALVHSRFSTNTFPTWDLAHPFRFLAHNGEINTIKGNIFKMNARESEFISDLFGDDIKKLLPIIQPGGSDSASLDNALELLVACGRSLPHAMMMLIPEAWNDRNPIPDHRRAFYEYYSTFMEPWDGPATIAFTDGKIVGATLDRNGLRPARYVVTKDDMIVFASEVGVQSFEPERIQYKGRLHPGKMLVVDVFEGRIISDDEIKDDITTRRPYREWVEANRISLADIAWEGKSATTFEPQKLYEYQRLFGYTIEDVNSIVLSMARDGEEPTGSMGTDTPLAVLSERPQRLFNYFKQLFAQVTNPPIDPIREELVMSLTSYVGPHKNLLDETPEHCRMIKYFHPIFTNAEIEKLTKSKALGFKTKILPILFKRADGAAGLKKAMDDLCAQSKKAIAGGCQYLLLSDRQADEDHVPIPAFLACSGLHHYLIREKLRMQVGLIIESGEIREVMHCALLCGYGADIINPYLAFAIIADLTAKRIIDLDYEKAEKNYIKAMDKGLLKVLSKMGISTLRSYKGSQLFECLGLTTECVDRYFTGTTSRIGGLGVEEIGREALLNHDWAYAQIKGTDAPLLPSEGVYRYRRGGERHAWNPETISLLQRAVRENNGKLFKEFTAAVNTFNCESGMLRGFVEFKPATAIPIEEVEPAHAIVKRFCTGAMSFGSISKEAHESLGIAMNTLGGKSNTGEGGEDSARFTPRQDGTLARSAIKQIASGRFGVTNHYLRNADEIQIKIAQGAKPGEGGQLPGFKVDEVIARLRHSTPGVTLISPPPHHDIYSIEDLAQLIFDLKHVNPKAVISVKLVAEAGVGTVAAGVAKAHADTVTVSGYEGGTGASPISSIRHAGIPWELGIAETQQTLVLNKLRGIVKLHTDGQLKTGRDVVIAALLGAEEFGFATGPLIALGCIMMRKCHLNTCPVGVATQDPELRKRFAGEPSHVIRYFSFLAQEIREIMASLGVRKFDELIGRVDMLGARQWKDDGSVTAWKTRGLDLSMLLYKPEMPKEVAIRCVRQGLQQVDRRLDGDVLDRVLPLLQAPQAQPIDLEFAITNVDRAVGAMLSGEISDRFGEAGLPEDTVRCRFVGTAGQSFGAFLASGLTFKLEGDSNDYLGKSLSGGRIIVVPPTESTFIPERNIIIGNTVLYGAIAGDVYIRGMAGERFCVRNSGAIAVVEGVGDHGCEYMTGGCVVVLGKTGRNFAAGMSGGIAYVFDPDGGFSYFCNPQLVELSPIQDADDEKLLKSLIERHVRYTDSELAKDILGDWKAMLPKFVKLTPMEYRRALAERGLKPLFYEKSPSLKAVG